MTMPTMATITTRPTATMTRIWPGSLLSRLLKRFMVEVLCVPCRDRSRRLMSPMSGCLVGELDRLSSRGCEVEGAHQVADDWCCGVVAIADRDLGQAAERNARRGVWLQASIRPRWRAAV